MRLRPLCLIVAMVFVFIACKDRAPEESEAKGIKDSLANRLNPRLARHADEPWMKWQWYTGSRDDSAVRTTQFLAGMGM